MVKRVPMIAVCLSIILAAGLSGCTPPREEVVVYAALDKEFSEPILNDFQTKSGVAVLGKWDVESTKTVGLVNAILQERRRPRCDVFWNNEILNTLRLEQEGLLAPFTFPGSERWPAAYRSPNNTWYGFAARARVLVVNKDLPSDQWPTSVKDLADPKWKGKCALAKPLFGTTASHAAVLFEILGEDAAKKFFQDVRANAEILSGNKQVALAVASGQLAWGLTDTDDAYIEKSQGQNVEIVFPDQGPEGMGCLLIPNTIALIKGSPHPQAAQQLAEYLYDSKNGVEQKLATGPSAQLPLGPGVDAKSPVIPDDLKWLEVDFTAAARRWDQAAAFLRDEFAAVKP